MALAKGLTSEVKLTVLRKFAHGEMGLAKTFWGGYVGISVVLAIIGGTIATFLDSAGLPVMIIALTGALFASWAVVAAAGRNGSRTIWGWIASAYVVIASAWAVFSIGGLIFH